GDMDFEAAVAAEDRPCRAGDEQQRGHHGQRDPRPAPRGRRRCLAVDAQFLEQIGVRVHRGQGRRKDRSVTAAGTRAKWPEVTRAWFAARAALSLEVAGRYRGDAAAMPRDVTGIA